MKINKKMLKKIGIIGLISAEALNAAANAGEIKAAFNPNDKKGIVTVEESRKISDDISCYGFADFETNAHTSSLYGEARIFYSMGQNLGLIGEYNGGTGYADTLRLGIGLKGSIGKNNFTLLKLLPFETTGQKGPQISLFTSQNIGSLCLSVLADFNAQKGTIYLEPTATMRVNDELYLMFQGRQFGNLGGISLGNFSPYLGIGYKFNK